MNKTKPISKEPIRLGCVIDKTRDSFKAIVEVPGKNTFWPSSPNHKEYRTFRPATLEELYSMLFSIGIRLIAEKYEETVEMVAYKFYKELCTEAGAWYDEAQHTGFYIEVENEPAQAK